MLQDKNGTEPTRPLIRWLPLILWIALSAVLFLTVMIVINYMGREIAFYDVFTNDAGKYCVRYDSYYSAALWEDPDMWSRALILMDVHTAEDLDFDDYYGEYISEPDYLSESDETKSILAPFQWMLNSGIRTYGAMKIYDSNGNVFKGTNMAMVQSEPCSIDFNSTVECKDHALGFTNVSEDFTEKEIDEIAEILEQDSHATVAFDRYILGEEPYKVFIPLSVVVRGDDGSEKLHMTLSRQEEPDSGTDAYTEEVYVHRPSAHFQKMTDFRRSKDAAFEEWIDRMQKNKDPKADWASYMQKEKVVHPRGFGPIKKAAMYYEGQELTTYTYYYCSMLVPFLRVFFLLWGVFSLLYRPVILLIRRARRKKRISQS